MDTGNEVFDGSKFMKIVGEIPEMNWPGYYFPTVDKV